MQQRLDEIPEPPLNPPEPRPTYFVGTISVKATCELLIEITEDFEALDEDEARAMAIVALRERMEEIGGECEDCTARVDR